MKNKAKTRCPICDELRFCEGGMCKSCEEKWDAKQKEERFVDCVSLSGQRTKAGVYIERVLSGDDYGRGEIESIRTGMNNVHAAFGRLVQILNDKNIITDDDVYTVGRG